jgi:hypothetical protein
MPLIELKTLGGDSGLSEVLNIIKQTRNMNFIGREFNFHAVLDALNQLGQVSTKLIPIRFAPSLSQL